MDPKILFSSNRDDWKTPIVLFKHYDDLYHFNVDLACDNINMLCKNGFTKDVNSLDQCWDNIVGWLNPPYSRNLYKWVHKAVNAKNSIIVMLIPSRTDTKWFHDLLYNKPNIDIQFLRGRLCFDDGPSRAPFPSMIVIINNLNTVLRRR